MDTVAVDGEGDAIGLGDLDRLEVTARRHGAGLVLAVSSRDRLDVVLLDLQHPHLVEVDDAEQTFDWAGVAVVVGGTSQIGNGTRNAMVGFERVPHRAGGEHVNLNEAHVGNPATRERLDHQRILLDSALDGEIFVIGNGRLRTGEVKILGNRAGVEIDSNFAKAALGVIDCRPAVTCWPRAICVCPGQVGRLVWIAQTDVHEDCVGRALGGACDLSRSSQLVGSQRMQGVQRVRHTRIVAQSDPGWRRGMPHTSTLPPMTDAPNHFDRGIAAYEAGDFAAAQTHWEEAAEAGDLQARDHLMLLNTGATRRRVLLERMAERDNANALWSLGVAAVEQADLPGVRMHWAQAAELDPALADELAGLLECDPAAASERLRTIEDGPLAFRLGELCLSTGLNETALVWWNLAVIAGSPEAEALFERFTDASPDA